MEKDFHDRSRQVNLGAEQKVAGRDFYEIVQATSMPLYLLVTPMEKLDEVALENEYMFIRRFGFDGNLSIRQQTIAIRREHHFSDKQMRLLWRSKDLRVIRGRKVELAKPSWLFLSMGYFNIAWLTIVALMLVLQVHFSPAPIWKSFLGQTAILTLGAIWWWLNWNLSIRPWRWLREAGC